MNGPLPAELKFRENTVFAGCFYFFLMSGSNKIIDLFRHKTCSSVDHSVTLFIDILRQYTSN